MGTLSEIARTYPTDKLFTHNYYDSCYEEAFKNIKYDVKKLCEVGIGFNFTWGDYVVKSGNSLRVWRDYFVNAEILGLDISTYPDMDDMDRIKIDWIDQSKKDLVEGYSKNLIDYDVIIDDGSHNVYDQTITFYHFFKSLKSGGVYVIEDLHSSIEVNIPEKTRIWGWGEPGFITPLEMLDNFIKNKTIINDYLNEEEKKYLEDNIKSAEVYRIHETSITSVIIKK